MKLIFAKYLTLTSLFLTTVHFFSLGVINFENFAMRQLETKRDEVITPLLQQVGYEKTKPQTLLSLSDLAEREAIRNGINPSLLRSLISIESNWKPLAISNAGAVGLTQVMPANYKRCGLESPAKLFDPELNIKCGAQILKEELRRSKNNVHVALQSYNGGSIRNSQTEGYANLVLAKWSEEY